MALLSIALMDLLLDNEDEEVKCLRALGSFECYKNYSRSLILQSIPDKMVLVGG
jgi:hypothetical protein